MKPPDFLFLVLAFVPKVFVLVFVPEDLTQKETEADEAATTNGENSKEMKQLLDQQGSKIQSLEQQLDQQASNIKDLKLQLNKRNRQQKEHEREMKQLLAEREDLVNRLAIAEKENEKAWCSVQTPADKEMWEYQGDTGNWVPYSVSLLGLRIFSFLMFFPKQFTPRFYLKHVRLFRVSVLSTL